MAVGRGTARCLPHPDAGLGLPPRLQRTRPGGVGETPPPLNAVGQSGWGGESPLPPRAGWGRVLPLPALVELWGVPSPVTLDAPTWVRGVPFLLAAVSARGQELRSVCAPLWSRSGPGSHPLAGPGKERWPWHCPTLPGSVGRGSGHRVPVTPSPHLTTSNGPSTSVKPETMAVPLPSRHFLSQGC